MKLTNKSVQLVNTDTNLDKPLIMGSESVLISDYSTCGTYTPDWNDVLNLARDDEHITFGVDETLSGALAGLLETSHDVFQSVDVPMDKIIKRCKVKVKKDGDSPDKGVEKVDYSNYRDHEHYKYEVSGIDETETHTVTVYETARYIGHKYVKKYSMWRDYTVGYDFKFVFDDGSEYDVRGIAVNSKNKFPTFSCSIDTQYRFLKPTILKELATYGVSHGHNFLKIRYGTESRYEVVG